MVMVLHYCIALIFSPTCIILFCFLPSFSASFASKSCLYCTVVVFAAQNTHIWLAEWYHVEWHETGLCLSSATKSPPSRLRKEQNWFEKQESDPKHTSKSTTDCCSGAKIALQQCKTNRKHVLLKLDLQANKSEGVLGLSQDRKNPVKNSYIKLQAVCFQLQQ